MHAVGEVALDVLQRLPDDCTWEDVRYHLYVAKSVMAGLEDIEVGRTISQEEMKKRVGQWLTSPGPSAPLPS